MEVLNYSTFLESEVPSDQVYYALDKAFRFEKIKYDQQLPENLLLIYPLHLETHFGLTYTQLLNWYQAGIYLNYPEIPMIYCGDITPNDAMDCIRTAPDDIIMFWISKQFSVRLRNNNYNWDIFQSQTGELLLHIKFDSMESETILFTRQAVLYIPTD